MKLQLENMTTEQKLGMVLCVRRFWDEDMEFILELVKKRAVGCIQLHASQKEKNKKILEAADYPILVFNDTESGFPGTDLPQIPLMSLAASDKDEYYEAFAKGIVRDAKAQGFNGTWGPVIDVLSGDGPCKVHRTFSNDPLKVGERAEKIAKVFKQNHYLSCGKHYPGGADGIFDTHMAEAACDYTKEELIEKNLKPYKYLLERDLLPSIMTGHTVYKNIDPDYPASLSKKVIDIIREMGFDGITFTDSFAMMAVLQKYGEENIYGRAIYAGNDIVLPNYRTSVKDCFEMLKKNYEDGAFSEERLNEAVRRVLTAMEFVDTKPENPTPFTEKDRQLLDDVAKDCITAVTEEGYSAALTGEDKDKLFIILTDNDFKADAPEEEITERKWYFPNRIAKKIKETFPESGVEFLPEFSSAGDNERVLNMATKYKEVVFITFCVTYAYMGTDGLTRRAESVINALANSKKVSAVVHFGNPYALKYLLPIPRKIYGYKIPDSQIHAIDVLKGTLEAKGTLPYDLNK